MGTVELTGLEMMLRRAPGQCLPAASTRPLTMPALIWGCGAGAGAGGGGGVGLFLGAGASEPRAQARRAQCALSRRRHPFFDSREPSLCLSHLEQVVACHARLAGHPRGDDHQVAARQRVAERVGPFEPDCLGLGVDVADVGGDALGAGDIVEGEVGDVRVHLLWVFLGGGRRVFWGGGGA
jgi:hypothetical protein